MPEALAKETDLTNKTPSITEMRDFFLTLINANDRRYSDLFVIAENERGDIDKKTLGLLEEMDRRYEQRFMAQQLAMTTAFVAQEKMTEKVLAERHIYFDAMLNEHRKYNDLQLSDINARAREMDSKFVPAPTLDARYAGIVLMIEAVRDASMTANQTAKEAVNKAETASEKRFDGVNEFRQTLADQQRTLMPRSEVDVIIKGLEDKIAAQNQTISDQNGRIIALASAQSGQKQGIKDGWGLAVGIVGFVLVILSIMARFAH
jgi:hypothetical protein